MYKPGAVVPRESKKPETPDVAVSTDGKVKFFHGRSTDTELEATLSLIRSREYGDLISYDELEAIIKEKRGEGNRFRSVMGRVVKTALRELSVCLKARPNEGYVILTPSEQVVEGTRKFRSGVRQLGRGSVIAQVADRARLTEPERRCADFLATRMVDIVGSLKKEGQLLSKVASTKTLPWPKPQEETA